MAVYTAGVVPDVSGVDVDIVVGSVVVVVASVVVVVGLPSGFITLSGNSRLPGQLMTSRTTFSASGMDSSRRLHCKVNEAEYASCI